MFGINIVCGSLHWRRFTVHGTRNAQVIKYDYDHIELQGMKGYKTVSAQSFYLVMTIPEYDATKIYKEPPKAKTYLAMNIPEFQDTRNQKGPTRNALLLV